MMYDMLRHCARKIVENIEFLHNDTALYTNDGTLMFLKPLQAMVLLLFGLAACERNTPTPTKTALASSQLARTETAPPSPQHACTQDKTQDDYIRRVIETLAQPAWEGRKFGSNGLEAAVAWAGQELACIGVTPGVPSLLGLSATSFAQPFEAHGDNLENTQERFGKDYNPSKKYQFTNLVGSIPGAGALAREVLVVGAHIDHLGAYGNEGLLLGANDNASGVLGLLLVAKQLLTETQAESRRTVVFAIWGAEEDPFYLRGSSAFLQSIAAADPESLGRIMYYINFDMIGSYPNKNVVYALGTFQKSTAYRLLRELLPQSGTLEVALEERGDSSDQEVFCEQGIPYVFFWTEDDCYHKPCDTPKRIDPTSLAQIANLAAKLVQKLSVEPELAAAKAAFPTQYAKAYRGKQCASTD
jgi:hypothetical protein